MAKKPYIAEWWDEVGRHRVNFATAEEAKAYKEKMRALRTARELGAMIARGARKGPDREREVKRLARECTKIARMTALGNMPEQMSAA